MGNPEAVPQQSRVIIRWPQVHDRTGKSRTQTWRDELAGRFPRRVQLGPNSVGWYRDEIEDWCASRPRVGHADQQEAAK